MRRTPSQDIAHLRRQLSAANRIIEDLRAQLAAAPGERFDYADLYRHRAETLEHLLSEACDQVRRLGEAKDDLEAALDEADARESALEAELEQARRPGPRVRSRATALRSQLETRSRRSSRELPALSRILGT